MLQPSGADYGFLGATGIFGHLKGLTIIHRKLRNPAETSVLREEG